MRRLWKTGLIVLLAATLLAIVGNAGSGALFAQTQDTSKTKAAAGGVKPAYIPLK